MLSRLFVCFTIFLLLTSVVTYAKTPPQFEHLAVITADNARFIQDLWTLPLNGQSINDIVWSPDDNLLAVAADYDILLYDAHDLGKAPRILRGHRNLIWDLSFSPDSKSLASSSGQIALNKHGVFGADDNTARIWDIEKGYARVVITHLSDEMIISNVNFYDNGKQIVTVSFDHNLLRYWDSQTGKYLSAYPIEPPDYWFRILGNGFNEDGTLFGLGTIHNDIRLWHLTPKPELINLPAYVQHGAALAFSNNNHYIALASRYGTEAIVFNIADHTSAQVNTPYELIAAQAFDPTAQLLIQSTYAEINPDPVIRIRETYRGEQLVLINPSEDARIDKLVFSHNGKLLVALVNEWNSPITQLHFWGVPIR